ncbi:MAG: protein phosphatase 2C domain-containing protein [Thermoleophilia bacterium]|nr:protein phosphatase 2C domain-containing protein [Thermoleophilia bacterium]
MCDPPLFAVADGVGGAQAGEIASRLAAAALEERPPGSLGTDTLTALILEANNRIYMRALGDPEAAGMGTVVTALLVDETAATIAVGHVGDSRAYRIRHDVLEQLTPDHSLVGELVRAGRLSTEEAEQHPHRSVITRAVGTEPIVDVHTETLAALPGDLYLICSDGLTDLVRDERILELVAAAEDDPEVAVQSLVDAANSAGGIDNITVVLFEILDGDPVPPPAPIAVEPDDDTAEHAIEPESSAVVSPAAQAAPVQRHGAGAGGRWLALFAILLTIAIAGLVIWWSLKR